MISRLNCVNSDFEDIGHGSKSRGNSEGGSSTSSRRLAATNTSMGMGDTFKPLHIANLDQLLSVFSQMADFESVSASIKELKDKEISSQNVTQIFTKLNWRKLAGLEAIAICF